MAYDPVPEPEQRYTDANGRTWLRSGACNRCGDCCQGDPFQGEQGTVTFDSTVYCPLLRAAGDGTFLCSGRTSAYYLSGCNVWPQFPDQIATYPHCGYTFVEVVD